MRLFLIYFLLLSSNAFTQESNSDKIISIMQQQEQCWNNGDIDCFMKGYWNSDSLKFIGSNGITYGWKSTLDNYKEKYDSPEKMGKLKFDILEIEAISTKAYFVIGKWHLSRTVGDVGGHFTLLWRKISGEWKIVADHSS